MTAGSSNAIFHFTLNSFLSRIESGQDFFKTFKIFVVTHFQTQSIPKISPRKSAQSKTNENTKQSWFKSMIFYPQLLSKNASKARWNSQESLWLTKYFISKLVLFSLTFIDYYMKHVLYQSLFWRLICHNSQTIFIHFYQKSYVLRIPGNSGNTEKNQFLR